MCQRVVEGYELLWFIIFNSSPDILEYDHFAFSLDCSMVIFYFEMKVSVKILGIVYY